MIRLIKSRFWRRAVLVAAWPLLAALTLIIGAAQGVYDAVEDIVYSTRNVWRS